MKKKNKRFDFKGVPYDAEINLDKSGFEVIDEGVRELVKVIHEMGFETICSCGGHTHVLEAFPWLVFKIKIGNDNLNQLISTLCHFNSQKIINSAPRAVDFWSLNFIDFSGVSAAYLCPSDINEKKSLKRLIELCKDGESLAKTLREEHL